jgi:hypothetical protein
MAHRADLEACGVRHNVYVMWRSLDNGPGSGARAEEQCCHEEQKKKPFFHIFLLSFF